MARTQCQNAADSAALAVRARSTAAARRTYGRDHERASGGGSEHYHVAVGRRLSQVSVVHGAYHYDYTVDDVSRRNFRRFARQLQPDTSHRDGQLLSQFSRVFGLTFERLGHGHRRPSAPRRGDRARLLGLDEQRDRPVELRIVPGQHANTPNNTDPVFPQWGRTTRRFPRGHDAMHEHRSASRQLQRHASRSGIPALVNDYFQNARGSAAVAAFSCGVRHDHQHRRRRSISATPRTARPSGPQLERHQRQQLDRLQRLRRHQGGQVLRLHPGAGLLGQDVLHLAARSDQRLAEEYFFNRPRRHAASNDNTAAVGTSGNWQQPDAATTSSTTRRF